MTSRTSSPAPEIEVGDEEIVFGAIEMGRLIAWTDRGVYWNNGIYPDVSARIGYIEYVLAMLDHSSRRPSDPSVIRQLLESKDDVLVGIGLDALCRDLLGYRQLPHKDLAPLVLELAKRRKCCDEGFLSDQILATVTLYLDPRLGLDNDLHNQLDIQKQQRRAHQKAVFDAKAESVKRSRVVPHK